MQPFLMSEGVADHVLLMRRTGEGPEFFVRLYNEPGFGARCEHGPSLHSVYPAPAELEAWAQNGVELAAIEQADEGGRFMKVRSTYRIVLAGEVPPSRSHGLGMWLPVNSLERLARTPGLTSNELRTLCSLILSSAFDRACAVL